MCKSKTIRTSWPLVAGVAALLQACGGSGDGSDRAPACASSDSVAFWSSVAGKTNTWTNEHPDVPLSTPQEVRSLWPTEMASVHVAMYDALAAVTRTREPFAIKPQAKAPTSCDAQNAAATAAAYGVLKGMFPNRPDAYEPDYAARVAAIPDGDARRQGLALGAEVAAGVLALRADDGRMRDLPPFVPGDQPGQYRGPGAINPWMPYMKPFALATTDQFRSAAPPALDSAAYAADLAEVQALGSATSTTRTEAQTAAARFHTEFPDVHWTRNLSQFAQWKDQSLAENARLSALLWVSMADTLLGCWDSKYHYMRWRPRSAINLANTDGNDATTADPAWVPLGPVPPHPEYPAAHACIAGTLAAALTSYFGTGDFAFSFSDESVTHSTHTYANVGEMVRDNSEARIWGGQHFRFALTAGEALGAHTAQWIAERHFKK